MMKQWIFIILSFLLNELYTQKDTIILQEKELKSFQKPQIAVQNRFSALLKWAKPND